MDEYLPYYYPTDNKNKFNPKSKSKSQSHSKSRRSNNVYIKRNTNNNPFVKDLYTHTNYHNNNNKKKKKKKKKNKKHTHNNNNNNNNNNIKTERETETETKENVKNTLKMLDVESKYIHRSLKVYEKHYGFKYNIDVIVEIIYRLKVKDKLKHQKQQQNIFTSRSKTMQVLLSMDFSPEYIKSAIAAYQGIHYNIEILTEMIMNLRIQEKTGHAYGKEYYVGKMISSKSKKSGSKNNNDEFLMYQKMLSKGFENELAFNASRYEPRDINKSINVANELQVSIEDEYYLQEQEKQLQSSKLPEFVVESENETFLVDSCDYSVFDCNSFKRINYILYEYNEWIYMKDKDKKNSFYAILNNHSLSYSNDALLDDYHHLIYYHDFDQIYKNLTLKCYDDNPSHLIHCKCLIRNHRDRLKSINKKTDYIYNYFNTNAKETNIEQICDMIHCYFLHSYHLGLILTPNELIYIHNNKNINNFNQDEDDCDMTDMYMNGDTIKIQNIQKIVNRKRKRIEYLRRGHRLSNCNKFVTKIEKSNTDINNKNKNNNNYYLLMNKQIGIAYEYYDKQSEFYISAKYLSFGEEILNFVPINEWNVLKLRAENMKNKKYSKLLMADSLDNGCRIEEGSLMYIEHLLSIMIYCNFEEIQRDFVQSCMIFGSQLQQEQDVEEEKQQQLQHVQHIQHIQHNKYGNLGRRLFESVWVFGSTTNSSDIFYHSMCSNCKNICFSSTINCISLPLSTSSKIEVLLNYSSSIAIGSGGDLDLEVSEVEGVILQLKQNGIYSTMKYFDCEWISDFGGEAELFFFDNNIIDGHTFNINSIILIRNNDEYNQYMPYAEDYSKYLICLNLFDKIFAAGYFFGISDLNNNILDTSVDLLNSELNYNILDHVDHENIPNYISNLIHLYCTNLLLIKINWPDLLHYYSFIASFLCYKENEFINLRLIVQIFTSCKKIVIHGGNPSILSLNRNKMDYIYSFLYQNRQRINLKIIEITSISQSQSQSTLSFKQCIIQYQKRFKNINCNIFIQNPKVHGAPQSLIIQC